MSKIEKILKKWRARPTSVDKNEVIKMLERYGFDLDFKPGSHIVVSHLKLKNHPGFGALGEFTVPIKSGKSVKGVYLRKILKAMEIVSEGE